MVMDARQTERSLDRLRKLTRDGKLRRPDGRPVASAQYPPLTPQEALTANDFSKGGEPVIRSGIAGRDHTAWVVNAYPGLVVVDSTQQGAEDAARQDFDREYRGRRPPPGFQP